VSFGHIDSIGRRVIVLGGGNTAMDCCRSSRRLGGTDVKVIVRSGFEEMKASPWEKEDAMHEGIPILNFMVPKTFEHEAASSGHDLSRRSRPRRDEKGRRQLVPTGEPDVFVECDDVLIAVGQENHYPWIERDIGIEFGEWDMPKVDPVTMQSSIPNVFFGGDAAFGPKNIIWAVAHGHDAAISIDRFCHGEDVRQRPAAGQRMISQKMGIHEWSYDNDIAPDERYRVPLGGTGPGAEEHHHGSRARLRHRHRLEGSAALPQLRRADGVREGRLHRVRRLRGHLPDGLHHLRGRRAGREACASG
jgi:hypothetical protein